MDTKVSKGTSNLGLVFAKGSNGLKVTGYVDF